MALLTVTSFRIIRYCSMADFPFFKMAAFRHLGFSKVGNFNCPYPSDGQSASSWKNFAKIGRTVQEILPIFDFFKMAAAAILDFGNFKFLTVGTLKRVELRLCAKFCRNCLNRGGYMAIFRFFKMAAAAILDFGNFNFLTVGTLKTVELRLHAKCCRNRLNRGWDMAIFRFFMMAAVRHLGLVLRVLGPPTKSTWWSLWLCKIWW